MTKDDAAFWMIPREIISLENPSFTEQRALITYNIIFNGPLIISDSDFVNNLHLRDAILNDSFAKELIEYQYIQFAVRTQNSIFVPFASILESIRKNNGHNPLIPEHRLIQSDEFIYIEKHALRLPFSFARAGERYTHETLRLFESLTRVGRYSKDLPPEHAQVIYEVLQEYVEKGEILTWSHFLPEKSLWPTVAQRLLPRTLQEQHKTFAFEAVRGPYVTFLPEILRVNPTYSKEDSLGIDIWRGRHLLSEKELARKRIRSPRRSLTDYIAALAALSVQDIHRLRQSNERVTYDTACSQFSKNATDVASPLGTFLDYRRLVDDTIFNTLGKQTNQSATFIISVLEGAKNTLDSELGAWIKYGIRYALDFFTLGIPSALEFAYTRLHPKKSLEIEHQLLMHTLEQEGSKSLDATVTMGQPEVRDFCTSVN